MEGGGPRKPTWDLSGLRVLSLNEASRAYHMPQHFLSDSRPQMAEWLHNRRLPATAEQQAELLLPWRRGTKRKRQVMPTLQLLMQATAYIQLICVRSHTVCSRALCSRSRALLGPPFLWERRGSILKSGGAKKLPQPQACLPTPACLLNDPGV